MIPPENRFPKSRNARVTGFMSSSSARIGANHRGGAKNDAPLATHRQVEVDVHGQAVDGWDAEILVVLAGQVYGAQRGPDAIDRDVPGLARKQLAAASGWPHRDRQALGIDGRT